MLVSFYTYIYYALLLSPFLSFSFALWLIHKHTHTNSPAKYKRTRGTVPYFVSKVKINHLANYYSPEDIIPTMITIIGSFPIISSICCSSSFLGHHRAADPSHTHTKARNSINYIWAKDTFFRYSAAATEKNLSLQSSITMGTK